MSPRKRIFLLVAIMAIVSLVVESIGFSMLYRMSFNEQKARLVESVKSQARLIEAIARFDNHYMKVYPRGARQVVLSQIVDAHDHYEGLSKTGEFTLAQKEGDMMVYLLRHRHYDLRNPKPIPFDSKLAEPMRLALSGRSGTVVGLDYRGVRVLAAYEPVKELNMGIVAKIDLAEIRAPFTRAGLVGGLIGVIAIAVGAALFIKVTDPLLEKLKGTVNELQDALGRVKLLSGLLPICASCKKIRDVKGHWTQIESYVRDHSEAQFTHGVCPECATKLYPELHSSDKTT